MKIEFKYPPGEGSKIIESFSDAHCYPYQKRVLNDGMLAKYNLTTGSGKETVLNLYMKKDGSSSSVMLEKGNDEILEELINFANSGIDIQPRIGIDEAGKGDYFGPLVVAAVGVDKEREIKLRSIGVADSKNITDKGIKELAEKIKKICPYSVVPIGPKKYNELYESIRNLNKLLAWGHARALENILDKQDYPSAISDKFSSKDTLKRALLEKGKKIKLIEKVRAEADTAVAAASILARAEFLDRLRKLSKLSGVALPKGCSGEVVAVAKSLLEKFGEGSIPNYVKLHFKTTRKVLE